MFNSACRAGVMVAPGRGSERASWHGDFAPHLMYLHTHAQIARREGAVCSRSQAANRSKYSRCYILPIPDIDIYSEPE